jgi:hypothetical protein
MSKEKMKQNMFNMMGGAVEKPSSPTTLDTKELNDVANEVLEEVTKAKSDRNQAFADKYKTKSNWDKELVGIYLEPDNKQKLDKLAKKYGRGAKSDIMNRAFELWFRNEGITL